MVKHNGVEEVISRNKTDKQHKYKSLVNAWKITPSKPHISELVLIKAKTEGKQSHRQHGFEYNVHEKVKEETTAVEPHIVVLSVSPARYYQIIEKSFHVDWSIFVLYHPQIFVPFSHREWSPPDQMSQVYGAPFVSVLGSGIFKFFSFLGWDCFFRWIFASLDLFRPISFRDLYSLWADFSENFRFH